MQLMPKTAVWTSWTILDDKTTGIVPQQFFTSVLQLPCGKADETRRLTGGQFERIRNRKIVWRKLIFVNNLRAEKRLCQCFSMFGHKTRNHYQSRKWRVWALAECFLVLLCLHSCFASVVSKSGVPGMEEWLKHATRMFLIPPLFGQANPEEKRSMFSL